jgi:hypothetical protein
VKRLADCVRDRIRPRRSTTLPALVAVIALDACATRAQLTPVPPLAQLDAQTLGVELQQENAVKLHSPAGAIYNCQRSCLETDALLGLRNVLPVLPDIRPPDQRHIERCLIVASIGGKELNRSLWVALDPRLTVPLKPVRELGTRHGDLCFYA